MFDLTYNTIVVLLGTALLGAGAGLVGCFAVLRGRALVGDVIAHSALPGLCLAFLIAGRRNLTPLLIGALATGVLSVLLLTVLRRVTRVKDDALLGTIRSVFFGAGVVLITYVQNRSVDGSKAGLKSYILGKTAGMVAADVQLIGGVALAALLCIILLYKELRLASFDPGFARVQGWPALLLDNVQLMLAALITVVGLPAVGAVLVAAMLILPGVTMRFWTDRLSKLLIGAALIGAAIGGLGTLTSAHYSLVPAGPVIILVGTAFFLVSMLFAPRRGVLARAAALRDFRRMLLRQRILSTLFKYGEGPESEDAWLTVPEIAATFHIAPGLARRAVNDAVFSGTLVPRSSEKGTEFGLTDYGWDHAALVVRGERLWQSYLAEHPDLVGQLVDLDLTNVDDYLPANVVRRLEAALKAEGRLPETSETVALAARGAKGGRP
ncbi:MAG: iron chelate uptake ABC transporter family permease subunit [Pirellulales bacterium]